MGTGLEHLTDEAVRLSGLLDKGIVALRDAGVAYAEAEHEYRSQNAMAYLETESGTVAEREAHTYALVGDYRRRYVLADGHRTVCLEAVRSRRAQLSALQSILAAHRAESQLSN